VQQIEPNVANNPFSLSNIHGMKSIEEYQSVANLKTNDEELISSGETNLQKDNSYSENDDVNSISSVGDTDE